VKWHLSVRSAGQNNTAGISLAISHSPIYRLRDFLKQEAADENETFAFNVVVFYTVELLFYVEY
jgi:hypothetical protein